MPPAAAVTEPAVSILSAPVPKCRASTPSAPATVAALSPTAPTPLPAAIRTPASPVPVTEPVALTETSPVPLEMAAMPMADPDTAAAVIVIPAPPAPSSARMPSPPAPVIAPLTLIETDPPPVLCATMPLDAPLTARPVADCVKVMPAEPGWVRVKAFAFVSTGVSEFSVTCSGTLPLAARACAVPIRWVPLHTYAPGVPGTGLQPLVKKRTRSNSPFAESCTKR